MFKEKNIIIVNDCDFINGGATKVAIMWARILRDEGHHVVFFCAVHKEGDKVDGVRYVTTNQQEFLIGQSKIAGAFRGLYNRKAYRMLKELLAEYDPEETLVYVHSWTKALSCSIWNAAKEMKFPLQVTAHDYFLACPNGGFFNYKKNEICHKKPMSLNCILCNCDSRNYAFKLYRVVRTFIQNSVVNVLHKTRRIITISNFSEHILRPFFPKNIEIVRIPNPIDKIECERIHPESNEYFLFVGRLSKEKGCEVFCRALKELDVKGIIVGDGPELEPLKQEYSSKKIKFVGWKSRSEVFEYMKKARSLVFPSLWYEAAPLVIYEALSMGLPCVVSNCCAARDYISDGKNGFVFDGVDELMAILKKLTDSALVEKLSHESFSGYKGK